MTGWVLPLSEGVLKAASEFISSAVDGLVEGGGLIGHGNGLTAFEASFDQATQAVIAILLFTVLIAQVDLDSGNAIAKCAQRIFHNAPDLISQSLMTFNIVISPEFNFHGDLLKEGLSVNEYANWRMPTD
jgi:hypothetical protein